MGGLVEVSGVLGLGCFSGAARLALAVVLLCMWPVARLASCSRVGGFVAQLALVFVVGIRGTRFLLGSG